MKAKNSRENKYEKEMKDLEKKFSKEMADFKRMGAGEQREFLYHGFMMMLDMIQMHEKDIVIVHEWLRMVEPKKFEKARGENRGKWEEENSLDRGKRSKPIDTP